MVAWILLTRQFLQNSVHITLKNKKKPFHLKSSKLFEIWLLIQKLFGPIVICVHVIALPLIITFIHTMNNILKLIFFIIISLIKLQLIFYYFLLNCRTNNVWIKCDPPINPIMVWSAQVWRINCQAHWKLRLVPDGM